MKTETAKRIAEDVDKNPHIAVLKAEKLSRTREAAATALLAQIALIRILNPGYKEHKKAAVMSPHEKHVSRYEAGCGECHHDNTGKRLDNTVTDDAVQGCASCHPVPENEGEKDKFKKAMHNNCKGCHRKHNKETDTKDVPVTCSKCHIKE
ncbi:cytochrome C [Candidatus Woesearchaeota archaeon]|nr:MAG: cytochrome C [Candidatus Woesearchaeota archaeon]